jgi:hypothetical protein
MIEFHDVVADRSRFCVTGAERVVAPLGGVRTHASLYG